MFAVIETGGKQYRVEKDSLINVERLNGNVGDLVDFTNVLLVSDEGRVQLGAPYVDGFAVRGAIVDQFKARKVRVMKMKRRKRYRRTFGHRQNYTKIRIVDFVTP